MFIQDVHNPERLVAGATDYTVQLGPAYCQPSDF